MQNINNSSSEIEDKNDAKCAPHLSREHGSCITLVLLIEMAIAYNKLNTNKIKLYTKLESTDRKKYKKYLLREFKKIYPKCKTQVCWLTQPFIQKLKTIARDELQKYTFRPVGPSSDNTWLNTININETMEQYQKVYPDFYYLGTVPRDFLELPNYDHSPKFYKLLLKNGINRVGIIYNTDKHNQSGQHWNAAYCDFKRGEIRFYDSYGVPPNEEVQNHMRLLDNFIKQNCEKITKVSILKNDHNQMLKYKKQQPAQCNIITTGHNAIRHQYKNSECGVYSMNFIIRMLKGESFDEICNSKIKDDHIQICRETYFRDIKNNDNISSDSFIGGKTNKSKSNKSKSNKSKSNKSNKSKSNKSNKSKSNKSKSNKSKYLI